MKKKNLFLFKTLGYSLALFVFWKPIAKLYGILFDIGLNSINPAFLYIMKEEWLYKNSMYLIPLFSLVLATPKIEKMKKIMVLLAGVFLIIVLDAVRVRFEIGNTGPSTAYAVYHTFKLLLPLALWSLACLPGLAGIMDGQAEESKVESHACPVCGTEHGDIVAHIKEVHGQKSLRIKKVRRFIAENQEMLAYSE